MLELLRHINRNRFEPIVVLPDKGDLYLAMRNLGIETRIVMFNPFSRWNPIHYCKTAINFYRIIRGISNVDIICVNNFKLNKYLIISSKLIGIPLICNVNLVLNKKEISRYLIKWVNLVIPSSKAVARPLMNYGISKDKISVIWSSVDVDKFRSAPVTGYYLRKEFGIKKDDYLIGIIGRIHYEKGHHILIEAISKINELKDEKIFLLINGYDDRYKSHWVNRVYIQYLKNMIEEKKLKKQIFFSGFIKNVEDVYNALNLLVIPSICEEASPIVQLEAMAIGIPVIATNVGGIPEVNKNNQTGLLCNPNDPIGLYKAIIRLKENKLLSKKITLNARRIIKSNYSIKNQIVEYEKLYKTVVR